MAALDQNNSGGWDFPNPGPAAAGSNNDDKKNDQAQAIDDFFGSGPDLSSAKPNALDADGLQKFVGFDTNSSLIQQLNNPDSNNANQNQNQDQNQNQNQPAAGGENDLAQFF